MAKSIYWKNFFLNFEGMNKISSTILAKFLKNYIVIKVDVVASKDATQLVNINLLSLIYYSAESPSDFS